MSLKQFVTAPDEADLAEWRWGKLIWHPDDDAGNLIRQRQWEGILGLRWNRELLIYAQRAFMSERFEDYNPQRKDLWQDQDRPWDFDHILASKYVTIGKMEVHSGKWQENGHGQSEISGHGPQRTTAPTKR